MKFALFFVACIVVICGEGPHPVLRGKQILKELQERRIWKRNARIVGGSDVDITEVPWQVQLLDDRPHFCGGSLIGTDWVVTAAHCVEEYENDPSKVTVGAGNNNYVDTDKIVAAEIHIHPNYDGFADGFPNDIALIKLSGEFTLSDSIKTTPLADDNEFDDTPCEITGWGVTENGGIGPVSPTLQKLVIPVISNTECNTSWTGIIGAVINDGHICVHDTPGKSACFGDSGGPLVCEKNEVKLLAGATSWGINTCSGEYPSVYTRISSFRGWINETSGI